MPDTKQWYGVYVAGKGTDPVAVFGDADSAQQYRKREYPLDRAFVGPVDLSVPEMREVAAGMLDPTDRGTGPMAAQTERLADDVLRAEIRTEVTERLRREAMAEEVEREVREAEDERRKRLAEYDESMKVDEDRVKAQEEAEALSRDPERDARGSGPSRSSSPPPDLNASQGETAAAAEPIVRERRR